MKSLYKMKKKDWVIFVISLLVGFLGGWSAGELAFRDGSLWWVFGVLLFIGSITYYIVRFIQTSRMI